MNKEELAKEIIRQLKIYKVIPKDVVDDSIIENVINGLDEVCFVESTLTVLEEKAKLSEFLNIMRDKRLKNLLHELEKIRIKLE